MNPRAVPAPPALRYCAIEHHTLPITLSVVHAVVQTESAFKFQQGLYHVSLQQAVSLQPQDRKLPKSRLCCSRKGYAVNLQVLLEVPQHLSIQ
jgi:hypothetical protein